MLKRIKIYQNRTFNKLKSQHRQVNKSKSTKLTRLKAPKITIISSINQLVPFLTPINKVVRIKKTIIIA
jgi:hypothetical protein